MDVGVFIPINNNGWLISENAPQYMPSFELNKTVVQKAEAYGMDFALSMAAWTNLIHGRMEASAAKPRKLSAV